MKTPEEAIKENLQKINELLVACTQIADANTLVFHFVPPNADRWNDADIIKYLPKTPIDDNCWRHSSKECGHTLEGPGLWMSTFADGFDNFKSIGLDLPE